MKFLTSIIILAIPTFLSAATFEEKVDISPLESISVQHQQVVKTLDSYSRKSLSLITGKGKLDGRPALFSVLDIAFRPEKYADRNLIKVRHVPLRQDFQQLEFLSDTEKDRIVKEGTISLATWHDERVRKLVSDLMSADVKKARAVQELDAAARMMNSISTAGLNLLPVGIIAPATDKREDHNWHSITEIIGNVAPLAEWVKKQGGTAPAALAGYDDQKLGRVVQVIEDLLRAWQAEDADAVNTQIKTLAEILPSVAPAQYPSQAKRNVEVVYNRLAKLTMPGAAFYFVAFVCLLMSARSGIGSLRLWGLRFFAIGLFVHTVGIAVRWWLIAGQHGSWFDGIPIKNQFESVMMSAWFGAVVGFILELRKGRGIFGAAASFVGWMSLVAIFSAPLFSGREIGGEIEQVQGVLMSYWLYVHVTMVVASYALIGMGFLLSVWWLVVYYRGEKPGALSRKRQEDDADVVGIGGGAVSISAWQTIARMLFFPARATGLQPVRVARGLATNATRDGFLAQLDACNLVVLQLAFWILGTGIVLGAIWADQSWGRPWGWDPKETFALVTWIVYLIVVHVRVATVDKAWWTAVLSVVGFFIMLFNWIGVNFFLVGLHSYA